MSFPRYSGYKASGLPWVAHVPEHWVVPAVGYRYEVLLGKMLDEKKITGKHLAPYLRNIDVQWDRIDTENLPQMDFHGDDLARYRLDFGDLLVCEGGDVGRAAVWRGQLNECYYQKALHRLRPWDARRDNPRFFLYVLKVASALGVFSVASGKSTIAHLTAESLRGQRFAFPPFEEQTAIVGFLDYETTKIDRLMSEQQLMIDLLKEKRQAVISEIVIRGLRRDAPMKPSGLEWLGDVPAHWTVIRVANIFYEVREDGQDGLPILSVSIHHGVSDKEYDEDEMDRKVTRSDDKSKYKRVAPGDLVYNMMRAWQGAFGAVLVPGLVSPAYVVARPKTPLNTTFMENLLRTPQAIEQMRRYSRGVTDFRLRLYWDEFKDMRIALPPLTEADGICKRIDDMTRSFTGLALKAEHVIELLQERRTALIAAAVTGRIDVRDTANRVAA